MSLVARHKKLSFYGVPSGTDGTITFHRMTKFTTFSQSKNPKEYSRQYVDEPHTQSDVVGFSPSISYAFDRHSENVVHKDMIAIADDELLGDDAVRTLLLVDTVTGEAIQRDYAVLPNSEGDSLDAYTYSGDFKCKGDKVKGTATSSDDWKTVTFTPNPPATSGASS